jgi:hypothetical protein
VIRLSKYFFLSIIILLPLLSLACSGTPRGTGWSFGQSLIMRVTDLQRVEDIQFSEDESSYIIQPNGKGLELAALKLEIRNNESRVVFLSIDSEAIKLRDKDGTEYQPIDFRVRGLDNPNPSGEENKFAPFLWGDLELPNKCGEPLQNCQLVGWVVFEVPSTMNPDLVVWESPDTIFLRF